MICMRVSRSPPCLKAEYINPREWKQEGKCYSKFCFKTIYRITKCERSIEFYSKSVRMTSFTFFFFWRCFFERWKRIFQRNWCWFLSRRGMELNIYIYTLVCIRLIYWFSSNIDGKIRNFLIKYNRKVGHFIVNDN